MKLDRVGIFKAKPIEWWIKKETSGAVAVAVTYQIVSQLDGSNWIDWSEYQDMTIVGFHYIVKKDGKINTDGVDQLVAAIGWDGNPALDDHPPDVLVQINVKDEPYNGVSRLKVAWLNPGDYEPTPQAASQDEVKEVQARFGSLLRAAASGAAKAAKPVPAPVRTKPVLVAKNAIEAVPVESDDDGVPF